MPQPSVGQADLFSMVPSLLSTSWDAKIDWKALSARIGHSDVAFTMRQYVQTDLEADRKVANTLAALIIGGSLASVEIPHEPGGQDQDDGDRPGNGDEDKAA